MPTIASGVAKKLSFKKQTGLGVPASGTGGTALSRASSTVDLSKATFTSNNLSTSQQRSDFRHGVRSVAGTISSDLIVGHFQSFEASILRNTWQAATTTGPLTTLATVASSSKITRTTGSFVVDGFKVGDVVRHTGFSGGSAPNNSSNFLITSVVALEIVGIYLDGSTMVDDASGESVTIATVGKKTFIPTTGHLYDYYTIEHYYSNIAQSEVFNDCVVSQMSVKLPPSGMATVDFDLMGLNMTNGIVQVLTTPTPAPNGGALASVNGAVFIAGVKVGLLTGLDFTVNGNFTDPGGVVGANTNPDLFPGVIDISGSMTVYFTDAVMRGYFIDETEVSVVAAFTSGNTGSADFKCYTFPRVKIGGAGKDDGEKGLIMTVPFTALENAVAGSNVLSTMSIQDSLAV